VYLTDGQLIIDNNNAERQLRAVAVGRKNWLFAGSFEGARRAALLYSLIQSCRLVDVSPFLYVRDILVRVATHPHHRLHELTPRGWKATFGAGLPA
jgi:transposase